MRADHQQNDQYRHESEKILILFIKWDSSRESWSQRWSDDWQYDKELQEKDGDEGEEEEVDNNPV